MNFFWILIIALGIFILAVGNRLTILGAGVGALLGIGILRFLPGNQDSLWWWILPVGLAVLFMIGAIIFKGFVSLVTLAIGAVAGGAIRSGCTRPSRIKFWSYRLDFSPCGSSDWRNTYPAL